MKKIILASILILFSFNAFGWSWKKKDIPDPPEKANKVCYYYLEYKENQYSIFSVFQEECSGIALRGMVSGRKIIEYKEDLSVKNLQTPTDDDTFREKVESLWPGMKEINLNTK